MSEPVKEKEEEEKDLSPLNPAVRIFLVEDNPDHVFIALTVVRQVLGDDIELVARGAAASGFGWQVRLIQS